MKKTETHDSAGELYDTIVALGLLSTAEKDCLDAGPDIRGGYAFSCPACDKVLSIYPGVVECRNEACRLLEWGDWADVAQAMAARIKAAVPENKSELDSLRARQFDPLNKIDQPPALFSLAGRAIGTPENLMAIQAKIKAGKSAVIGAMLASVTGGGGDCLWFSSSNIDGKAVIHFDTEQSRFDHDRLIRRSLVRAGAPVPFWLRSYYLKGLSIPEMKTKVELAIDLGASECGGIHTVFIDGFADLCADVNDSAEADALIAWATRIAMERHCLIVCVIHENPSSKDGKTRGHLGTGLSRKAETNLRIEKGEDGISVMYSDQARSTYIGKKDAPSFKWDDMANDGTGAHVSVTDTAAAQQVTGKKVVLYRRAEAAFAALNATIIRWRDLHQKMMELFGTSTATEQRNIRDMRDFQIIVRAGNGYVINHQIGCDGKSESA